jgi:hypothetical protein
MRVDRAGIVQTGLTGSAEARAGLPRSYWSCPSEGQPGPGLKQHPRLRPFGITTRRSGRRSRNAKQTHGLRAPPGRSAPPRPVAHSRGRPKSRALSPCGRGRPREARSGEGSLRPQHRLRRPGQGEGVHVQETPHPTAFGRHLLPQGEKDQTREDPPPEGGGGPEGRRGKCPLTSRALLAQQSLPPRSAEFILGPALGRTRGRQLPPSGGASWRRAGGGQA